MIGREAPAPPVGRLLGTAVAVRDLDAAVRDHEQLGFVLSDRSYRTEWGIEVATFGFADGTYVELVTPVGRDHEVASAMATYLDRHGEATYLTCLRVADVSAAHAYLAAQGISALGPPQPAPPSTGERARMLWLKPGSFGGAFFQLLELPDGDRAFARVTSGCRLAGQRLAVDGRDDLRSALGHLGAAPETAGDRRERHTFPDDTFVEAADAVTGFGIVTERAAARRDEQNHPREAAQ